MATKLSRLSLSVGMKIYDNDWYVRRQQQPEQASDVLEAMGVTGVIAQSRFLPMANSAVDSVVRESDRARYASLEDVVFRRAGTGCKRRQCDHSFRRDPSGQSAWRRNWCARSRRQAYRDAARRSILASWVGADVAGGLSKRLGLPVFLDNDANLGALAEMTLGLGVGRSSTFSSRSALGLVLGSTVRCSVAQAGSPANLAMWSSTTWDLCAAVATAAA
jgi:hypothetical protein